MTIFVFRSYLLTFSYGKQSLEVGLFLQKDLFFWPGRENAAEATALLFSFPCRYSN